MQPAEPDRTWPRERYQATARRCSLGVAGIGIFGMAAWLLNLPTLTSWHRTYVPMSPVTAAGLALEGYLYWRIGNVRGSRSPLSTRTLKLWALVIGLVGVFYAFTGVFGPVFHGRAFELPASWKSLSEFAVSPLTALSVSCAAVCLWPARAEALARLRSLCGTLIVSIHSVVLLGYLYGTPLLYGGGIRPVGITSAVGFILLGIALVLLGGPEQFPLKSWVGQSVQARLLRTFLPLTFLTVFLNEVLSDMYSRLAISNDALRDALQSLFAALVVCFAIERIARRIGAQIDVAQAARAEALEALRHAHEELESRVRERTAALVTANEHLQTEIIHRQQAQEAMELERRRQQALLDGIPAWVIRLHRDEVDIKLPAHPGIAAHAGSEWIEKLATDFLGQFADRLEQARSTRSTSDFLFEHGINGEKYEFEARIAGISKEEVVAIIRDVTDTRRVQRQILEVRTQEQLRIGRDMHDGLGQLLTGVAFLTKALHESLDARDSRPKEQAAEIGRLVSRAIAWTRRLAQGLVSPELEGRPLLPLLQELTEEATKVFQVRCTLSSGEIEPAGVQPLAVTHLFRIAQEAIHNAIRHGKATLINLHVLVQDGNLRLEITDNGCGFTPEPDHWIGVGLKSMQYRAHELGGTLEVRARPVGGTSVLCVIPQGPNSKQGR